MKIGNGELVTACDYQLDNGEWVSVQLHTDNAEEIIAALDAKFGACNYNARWTNSNLERVADAAAALVFEEEARAAAKSAAELAAKKAAVAGTAELFTYAGKEKARLLGLVFEWDPITNTYCSYEGHSAKKIAEDLKITEFRNSLSRHIQRNSKGGMWSWHVTTEGWEVPCSNSHHKFILLGEHL